MKKRLLALFLTVCNAFGLAAYVVSPFYWMCRTDKWLPLVGIFGGLLLVSLLGSLAFHFYLFFSNSIHRWLCFGLLIFDSIVAVGFLLITVGILVGGDTYLLFALDSCARSN
jgi:hypothetical protein